MKKSIRNAFGILLMSSLVFATVSCDDKDDPKTEQPDNGNGSDFKVDVNKFEGTISKGTVTLDAKNEYQLTGKLVIANGAKLVIPAGTKIVGTGGTSSYIAVAQGGKIEINGTQNNPVVLTGKDKTPGNWGGLVICGKAPINKGTTATSEVADLTYGGTEVADNSGSIKYLRIEYAGALFSADKEFNGLSLFGVGNGTTIEYVQLHNGSDDGIEFFGGTVNTKYIVSSNNEDDQFDWTEGWNGTNEFWYGKERADMGNHGIEADNNSSNNVATPIANPTIKNVTLIGRGVTGEEDNAMKLRQGTYAKIDNVVLSNWGVGFNVEHDATIAAIGTGKLKVTNVKFENVVTKSKGKNNAKAEVDVSAVFTEKADATGAGNGTAAPSWTQGWTVGL